MKMKIGSASTRSPLFGRLFDRYGIQIIAVGILLSLLTLPFGFLGGRTGVYVSVACWAIGIGAQDATLRSGIAQVVSMNKRGSAFGAFNAAYGVLSLTVTVYLFVASTESTGANADARWYSDDLVRQLCRDSVAEG